MLRRPVIVASFRRSTQRAVCAASHIAVQEPNSGAIIVHSSIRSHPTPWSAHASLQVDAQLFTHSILTGSQESDFTAEMTLATIEENELAADQRVSPHAPPPQRERRPQHEARPAQQSLNTIHPPRTAVHVTRDHLFSDPPRSRVPPGGDQFQHDPPVSSH
jgi:hypothetical protein